MKKLLKSAVTKVTVAVLLLFSLILTVVGIIVMVFLFHYGAYSDSAGQRLKEEMAYEHLQYSVNMLVDQYIDDFSYYKNKTDGYNEYLQERKKELEFEYSTENSNFFFTITDENNVVYQNYTDNKYIAKAEFIYYVQYSGNEMTMSYYMTGSQLSAQEIAERRTEVMLNNPGEDVTVDFYFIEAYVREDMTAPDWYGRMSDTVDAVFPSRYMVIGGTIAAFIVSIAFFIFLMASAGHTTKDDDSIVVGGLHKVPFDLLLVVTVGLFMCCFAMMIDLGFNVYNNAYRLLAILPMIGAYILIIITSMSFAVRIKAHCLVRGAFLYRLFSWLKRVGRGLWRGFVYIVAHVPLMWKTIIAIIGLSFIEFIVIGFTRYAGDLFMFWLFEKLLLIPLLLFTTICLCRLRDGAKIIAGGDLDFQIDTRYMYWDFKQHAENLNHISEGMSLAVEDRIKSERLKTELITNVSHDIKTPLTSIINYVDLLKKEKLDNERVNEYLEVLDRQSARLKKLIEDLVDASRFSTGNISVNLEVTSVNILLDQIVGEYGERLDKNQLKLIIDKPEEDLYIMADGRHIWRALDNLMINICKYAMPSSRVYISMMAQDGQVILTFRNISRDELNISSEELMERFVRGDKSRNTEGSGLGLSIARSLITLQGGGFEISIDGDLFKASVTFGQVFPE